MIEEMQQFISAATQKVKEVRFALAFAAIAAAVALSAVFLRGYLSTVGGVVVAVNMGVMLMLAVMMIIAASKAKGEEGKKYGRLYLVLAWVFSSILALSAVLSLASVFFKWPLNFSTTSIEPIYDGDYRIVETVMIMDLRGRTPTKGIPGAISKDTKYRLDRVVRQRSTTAPYELQWGTNGTGIENIKSSTNPGMTTMTVKDSKFFKISTAHTYVSSIPSDQILLNYPTDVKTEATFVNGFSGDSEEWLGACPNIDTETLTMVLLCPGSKPCKTAKPMEDPTGNSEVPFRGNTTPVISPDGKVVTWTIQRPSKGVGYFIDFTW
jgi:hypothetical protein